MKIIKLNAIDSTNSFLKELSKSSALDNFTVAVTKNQTKGRGQMESNWTSEPNKNLTFSVYLKNIHLFHSNQKYLNYIISLAVFSTLKKLNIPNICIKWPNDILSDNHKICGILIENRLRNKIIISSIVGIGLNVNQTTFPKKLSKVSSLKAITNQNYDLDEVLILIMNEITLFFKQLTSKNLDFLEKEYLEKLYRKDEYSRFKDKNGNIFEGYIRGISNSGKLIIENENKTLIEYGIKEISIL